MQTLTDVQLREMARKRVEFKSHLIVYFVIIGLLWFIWYVTGSGYLWPIWPMAGWGIAVIFHYIFDYRSYRFLSEEAEYNNLKKQMGGDESIAQ